MAFNKQSILDLQAKIQSKTSIPTTEEATKQWLIMPLIIALGYDPYSSDVIPEYTMDVGTKKGEKVDYAIQINSQPVMIIECKQFNTSLSEKHVSQLYRYFTVSEVHIAVLTNGDDYWFYTDSKKENVMDLEPYFQIKLSSATAEELNKLEQYSKELIQYTDICQVVQYERFQTECKELVHGLRTNTIPTWLLDILAERSGLFEIDKPTLAEYLYTEIKAEFNGFKIDKKNNKSADTSTKSSSLGDKMKHTRQTNKENKSNIKLGHEYVYNDYSDGDWKFHTIEYAIILGRQYDITSGRNLLVTTLVELLNQNKIDLAKLLDSGQFSGSFKIDKTGEYRGAHLIESHGVYISTSYGIDDIIKFISKLLKYCNLPDDSVKLSFKD